MNDHFSGKEAYDHYIKPVARVSQVTSLWPLDHGHSTVEGFLRICHRIGMLLVSVIMGLTVTADAVRHRSNMDEATECALIFSAMFLVLLRLINFTIHEKDMSYVIATMRNDWMESSPEDRLVLKKTCHFPFVLAKQFIVTVVLALILFVIVPILDIFVLHSEERILPFRGYYFNNQTSSPYYECLYVFTAIAGLFCGCTIASVTSFNLVSIMHGAAKFKILQKRLEAIKSMDPDCDEAMINCVELHQDAIKFANALERIINLVALGQFAISSGLICFAGFQITSMIQDKGRLMKYCSFLNSAILELFLFSFSGQHLMVESTAVGDSAYAADWIGSSFTQSLRILMMRTMEPSKITAAKFYDMSLQSFSSVLSTSFSYLTVLQTMNEE